MTKIFGFVRIVLTLLIGYLLVSSLIALRFHYMEQRLLSEVNSKYPLDESNLHASINSFRDSIWHDFMHVPQSPLHNDLWMRDRGLLRHSALETLSGEPALCGDFSRVMVQLLNQRGIKARRVYLTRDLATNHVPFEYYDPADAKWYMIDSYYSDDFPTYKITSREKFTVARLLKEAPSSLIGYTRYSYLNKQLAYKLNYFEIPVPLFFSRLMEQVYLLKLMFNFGATLLLLLVVYLLRKLEKR